MKALDRLREMIDSGDYPPSGRLPPERTLAPRLGVSRGALRAALAQLETEGRVWRHVGRGTFVGQRSELGAERLSPALRMTNPAEVMEVRLIIEPRIASMAALRASPAEIDHLVECLRHGGAAADTATFERWDGELHRTMACAARNSFLLAIFDGINDVRRTELWGRLKEKTVNPERRSQYERQHAELVSLIRDRDAEGAERVMRAHLEMVRDHLLAGHMSA